jgi:hypothetical protein
VAFGSVAKGNVVYGAPLDRHGRRLVNGAKGNIRGAATVAQSWSVIGVRSGWPNVPQVNGALFMEAVIHTTCFVETLEFQPKTARD